MSTEIISASIAAAVSLLGGAITLIAAKRSFRNEREIQARDQNRRLTERLYDIRLESYPRVFEITDRLRGEYIFSNDLAPEYLSEVLAEVLEWNRSKSAFVLSTDAMKEIYRIRGSLNQKPEHGKYYSENQKLAIWDAKNGLRRALRADLHLLYVEESVPEDKTS